MTAPFDIRLATPADAHLLTTQRVAMFRNMGGTVPEIEQPLLESCAEYFAKALVDGNPHSLGPGRRDCSPGPMRSVRPRFTRGRRIG